MPKRSKKRKTKKAEAKARRARAYVLRLYITGQSSLSSSAVRNLLRVCRDQLQGRYDVQVIDICQQPELAREAQIIATPTLVKARPAPFRKLVGNLSNQQQVLEGLGLKQ
jgi:circadian clock protein KaiB